MGVMIVQPVVLMYSRHLPQLVSLLLLLGAPLLEARRSLPKKIKPVYHEAVRYTVQNVIGGGGAVLEAHDSKTKKLRWRVQVFKIAYAPNVQRGDQDIYVTSLKVDREKARLVVIDEKHRVHYVSIATHKVTRAAKTPAKN